MKILANSTSFSVYPRDLFNGIPNAHWQHSRQCSIKAQYFIERFNISRFVGLGLYAIGVIIRHI